MHAADEMPLERLLRNAWEEPGLRPEFYKRLLESEVLVPVKPMPGQGRHGVIAAGSMLPVICLVRNDGAEVIPFYTSPERVFEGSPAGEKCVVMTTRELFESRRDMRFHINPFSRFGREFQPHEVALLLETGTLDNSVKEFIPEGEHVVLTSPKRPPHELFNALSVLFARNFHVKAAFAADLTRPGNAVETTLLIGIDLVSDHERILRETGTVVNDFVVRGFTVDLVAIAHDETMVSKYFFGEAVPFYEIGWAGRFMPN